MAKRSATDQLELQDKAKELYFDHKNLVTISKELQVSTVTLSKWREEHSWDVLREEADKALVDEAFATKRKTLSKIAGITTTQIERGLKAISDRFEPPTLKEVEMLSNILGNLDKIARLDAGKPTENVAVAVGVSTLTVEKIRDIVLADPFLPAKKE